MQHQASLPAEAFIATGAHWRQAIAEAPPVDLAAPIHRITIPGRCIRSIPSVGCSAIITRDTGYFTGGFFPLVAAERALHLHLAFTDPMTGDWREHDHDAAGWLCQGVFGAFLPLVQCQAQDTAVGRQRNAVHYRLVVAPDWTTPIQGVSLPRHATWEQRTASIAKRRASAA